jgi:hypothetical protein
MDDRKPLFNPFIKNVVSASDRNTSDSDSTVDIADPRLAQLLFVLHEIDQSVAGLEALPQTELVELVSDAILACGFVDGTEARYAIAAVLEAIERRAPAPEGS